MRYGPLYLSMELFRRIADLSGTGRDAHAFIIELLTDAVSMRERALTPPPAMDLLGSGEPITGSGVDVGQPCAQPAH
jgi:hypothetical protein